MIIFIVQEELVKIYSLIEGSRGTSALLDNLSLFFYGQGEIDEWGFASNKRKITCSTGLSLPGK